MRFYALVSHLSRETVEIYASLAEAHAALADAVLDEPSWHDVLSVVPLDLEAEIDSPACLN